MLMKKIRQSQTRPVQQQQQQPHNHTPQNPNMSAAGQLKRLRQEVSSTGLPHSNNSPSLSNNDPNITPAHAHQRPKTNNLWDPPPQQARHPTPIGLAPPHVGNLSRQPITTPPNVVRDMRSSGGIPSSNQQSLLMNNLAASSRNNSGRPLQQFQQTTSYKSQAAQMLMQKRTGNKSAIQKQVEQTLMQLPSKHVQQPITTLPNVVRDMRSSGLPSSQQSLLMNNLAAATTAASSRNRPLQQSQQTASFKSQAAQMLLQKRTAAKSAIQKQLEQTLMQLPPKHVQLGIDFVPNANNIEFIYYVGLEACVNYLTNSKNPLDVQPLEEPFECSTCGTDFTTSWSWKRSNPVCENCVSNHVKKSIKNSQANRIKSVLAKAAKQEQDMDQRILAEAQNVVSAAPTTPTSSNTHINTNMNTNIQPPIINPNPLASAALQPAALASLLQMNPQLSTLASLMTANNTNTAPNPTNNNQFAQVAALLMNQLATNMNMWKR